MSDDSKIGSDREGPLFERVQAIRETFAPPHDPHLPVWTPEQWIAALTVQLGLATQSLHSGMFGSNPPRPSVLASYRADGIQHLLAIAAIAVDAVEALEDSGA